MAWFGRIIDPPAATGAQIITRIAYFDVANGAAALAADIATALAWETFIFPAAWTDAMMADAVRSRGAEFRATKLRADALKVTYPAASTAIGIP